MKPLYTLIALSFVFITAGQLATAAQFIPLGILPGHDISRGFGVSDDGTVVAGSSHSGNRNAPSQAFRWTDATGMVGLGNMTGAGGNGQQPLSADGSRIAGNSGSPQQVFLYSQVDGIRNLGNLGIDTYRSSGISGDGNVVVGWNRPAEKKMRGAGPRKPALFRSDSQPGTSGHEPRTLTSMDPSS